MSAPVAVVQENPRGLPLAVQEKAGRSAISVDRGSGRIPGLAGALPIANTAGAFPGSRHKSTTVITFLYFRPGHLDGRADHGGEAYARRYAGSARDHFAGVTGRSRPGTSRARSSPGTCPGWKRPPYWPSS